MATSPDVLWDRDELILVLNLHRVSHGQPTQTVLTELSRDLRGRLTRLNGVEPLSKVRSTAGVKDKVDAFEALRLKQPRARGWSILLDDVWSDLGGDTKRIWDATREIREAQFGT